MIPWQKHQELPLLQLWWIYTAFSPYGLPPALPIPGFFPRFSPGRQAISVVFQQDNSEELFVYTPCPLHPLLILF